MHAEHSLTLVQVGQVKVNLAVKTSGAEQGLVKDIHTVGGSQYDDAAVGTESVHLGEQLVEGVLTLVIATHGGILAAGASYGIDLIDEYYAGSLLFGLTEQVTYSRCTHTHEHLHEIGA